jgi:hypothetical protein
VRTITLQKRSETIVQIPVECEDNQKEGLIEKCEIDKGIFVASSLTAVKNGYVTTSILNTNDHEVKMPESRLKLGRIENMLIGKEGVSKRDKYRGHEVLDRLRLEHLNSEERKILENTCVDYQDVFHLSGDKLSSTNATRHSIIVVPGTVPINTKPYRLPEAQKSEIEKQADKMLDEGIIEVTRHGIAHYW